MLSVENEAKIVADTKYALCEDWEFRKRDLAHRSRRS